MLLAMETSTMTGSVALVGPDRLVGEYTLNIKRTHSERLMPTLARVLADAGVAPEELAAVAVAIGPGSFTGLRIGVTCAKTLAFVLNKPLVAIPTLDALAFGVGVGAAGLVCPVLAARRGELYTALYRAKGRGERPERLSDYLAIGLPALLERIEAVAGTVATPVYFLGDAAAAVQEEVKAALGGRAVVLPRALQLPRAGLVGELAWERLAAGETVDPMTLLPLYVRRPDVEPPSVGYGRECQGEADYGGGTAGSGGETR